MVTGSLTRADSPSRRPGADIDLEHRLVNFLQEQQISERGELEVEVRGGVVVVAGQLPSQHAKWLCLGCCRHVAGVIKLIDEIEVSSAAESKSATDVLREGGVSPESGRDTHGVVESQDGRRTFVRIEPGASRVVRHGEIKVGKTREPISSVAVIIKTAVDD